MLRGHAAHGLAGTEKWSDDVGGEYALQSSQAHRLETHLCFENAGIVDQRPRSSQRTLAAIEQPLHIGLDCNVCANSNSLASGRLDLPDDLRRGGLVAQVIH